MEVNNGGANEAQEHPRTEAALCRLTAGTVDRACCAAVFVEPTTYSSFSLISPSKSDN
jgi:hypothetical protein